MPVLLTVGDLKRLPKPPSDPTRARRRPRAATASTGESVEAGLKANFGRNLRSARVAAGLTQSDLADATGIGISYIRSIESGKVNLTFDTATRLANAVKRETLDLLQAGEPDPA